MNRLNANGEDESQWIQPVLNRVTGKMEMPPIVNPWREAKGDIVRNEDDKLESIHWLPRILQRQGNITKEHFDASRSFERILVHARRTLGICNITGKIFDAIPSGGVDDTTDMFLEILRKVARSEVMRIVWLVDMNFPCSKAAIPIGMLGIIQHGLENIQNVIDMHNEKRNNAASTLPEVSQNLSRAENP